MGLLFNAVIIGPLRRFFARQNANWQLRKDAGEEVFPLKPDTVFLLSLVAIVAIGVLLQKMLN